jgi:hypothetical protein
LAGKPSKLRRFTFIIPKNQSLILEQDFLVCHLPTLPRLLKATPSWVRLLKAMPSRVRLLKATPSRVRLLKATPFRLLILEAKPSRAKHRLFNLGPMSEKVDQALHLAVWVM